MKKTFLATLLLALGFALQAADVKQAQAAVKETAKAAAAEVAEGAQAATELDMKALMGEAFRGHHHNRLVHFPVALGLVGVFFALMALRNEKFKTAARWTLFLAAVSSVFAYFTGQGAEEALDSVDGTLKQLVELHELQGIFVMAWLWASWAVSFGEWAKKWSWIVYAMTILTVCAAGMVGGMVAHLPL